jgi:hypothetical protein
MTNVDCGMCNSTETGGSATELSATDAWHEAVVDDDSYVRLIKTIARLSFSQQAQIVATANGHFRDRNIQLSAAGITGSSK